MRIDAHFHVIGDGRKLDNVDRDVYFYPGDNNVWLTKLLYNTVEKDLLQMGVDLDENGRISTAEYLELTYRLLKSSEEIDGIVLLALDALYSPETGDLDERRTDLWVTNRFLASKIDELNERLARENSHKRFFFGASVSPNRKDWEAEVRYVIEKTDAVLLKVIPSVQHIKLDDERNVPFYDYLASAGLPLLCHVGPEYAFPEGMREKQLDNFKFLERPLERGVTIIAAHCATPVIPIVEKEAMRQFVSMMKAANAGAKVKLWADTSALSLAIRIFWLKEIVNTFPSQWLIHGSDFPIPIEGWPHLPWVTYDMTPTEYLNVCRTKHPLDRDVKIKRAHKFSDSILTNASKVLRNRNTQF